MSSLCLLDPHTFVLCLSPPDAGVVWHRRMCEAFVSSHCMSLNHTGLPVSLCVCVCMGSKKTHVFVEFVYIKCLFGHLHVVSIVSAVLVIPVATYTENHFIVGVFIKFQFCTVRNS